MSCPRSTSARISGTPRYPVPPVTNTASGDGMHLDYEKTRGVDLFADVADAPNCFRTVVTHQQRSVFRYSNPNRSPPHISICSDEPGQKILIFAAGFRLLVQRNPDNFVAGTTSAVPGAVQREKYVPLVVLWKLTALVERKAKGSAVGLDLNIGRDHLRSQVRMAVG